METRQMKILKTITALGLILLIAQTSAFTQATGGKDNDYGSNIYMGPGGDSMVVKIRGKIVLRTGGRVMGGTALELTADTLLIKDGGSLVIESGGLFDGGTALSLPTDSLLFRLQCCEIDTGINFIQNTVRFSDRASGIAATAGYVSDSALVIAATNDSLVSSGATISLFDSRIMATTNSFTFGGVFRHGTCTTLDYLVDTRDKDSTGWYVRMEAPGVIHFGMSDDSVTTIDTVLCTAEHDGDNWFTLFAVRDITNSKLILDVNGIEYSSTLTATASLWGSANQSFVIGGNQRANGANAWDGEIDEILYWSSTALTKLQRDNIRARWLLGYIAERNK